jgi:2-polyprenyl-6-methoxyphenol hydroxylase-like FAD-dependent oxidoreductase
VKVITMSIKDASRATNWLPRTAFMQLLVDALAADPAAAAAVRVATATRAGHYQLGPDGRIAVTLQRLEAPSTAGGSTGKAPVVAAAAAGLATRPGGSTDTQSPAAGGEPELEVLYPRLLVACDGFRSSVRAALCSWSPGSYSSVTFPSLSTGLRYKVLRLPPNPVTKEGVVLSNSSFAVLEGASIPRFAGSNPLRMGLLPVQDPQAPRTGNLNLLPDHPFWEITEAEEMYDVLQQSFPQMDWRALVPTEVGGGGGWTARGRIMGLAGDSMAGALPQHNHCQSSARPHCCRTVNPVIQNTWAYAGPPLMVCMLNVVAGDGPLCSQPWRHLPSTPIHHRPQLDTRASL